MVYLWIALLLVLLTALWVTNLFGAPGNWLMILAVIGWMVFGPEGYQVGWLVLTILMILAGLGELVEFGASVFGTKKLGGTNRGATCSVVGSIVGGIAGAFLGIPFPVPLVGSLIGSLLFAGIGAWIGASLGERWAGKTIQESVQIGGAAFLGRILGTIGKFVVGLVMLVFIGFSLFF